jgi:hypothetical protein
MDDHPPAQEEGPMMGEAIVLVACLITILLMLWSMPPKR